MERIEIENELRTRKRFLFSHDILCFSYMEQSSQEMKHKVIRISVKDISYGGLGIICNKQLEIGDVLIFNLNKSAIQRQIKAQVRWQTYFEKKYIIGLEFYELKKDDVLLIHDIIKEIDRLDKKK